MESQNLSQLYDGVLKGLILYSSCVGVITATVKSAEATSCPEDSDPQQSTPSFGSLHCLHLLSHNIPCAVKRAIWMPRLWPSTQQSLIIEPDMGLCSYLCPLEKDIPLTKVDNHTHLPELTSLFRRNLMDTTCPVIKATAGASSLGSMTSSTFNQVQGPGCELPPVERAFVPIRN